jgi:hypothetical protein
MDLISELNNRSKKGPKQFRYIALYYLIVFWINLILSLIALFAFIIIIPADKLTFLNLIKIVLSLVFAILINFLVLKVALSFIIGSVRSYWILLTVCLIQCFAFNIGNTGFEFNFGGIPFTFPVAAGAVRFNINVIAVLFSVYFFSIRRDYKKYLLVPEKERPLIRYM